MKNVIAVLAVGGLAAAASAEVHSGLTHAGSFAINSRPGGPIAGAVAPTVRYSNTATFGGSGFSHGADTAWDDLNPLAAGPSDIDELTFSIANFGSAALSSVDVTVSFSDDAGLDGPDATDNRVDIPFGTLDLTAIFGGSGLGSFSVATLSATGLAGTATLPENPANFTWMGVTFENAVGVANADVGQALFDPPTVGGSTDTIFVDGTGATNFGGSPVANFGNALATVPAPGVGAVLGLGLIAAGRRRR